MLPVPVHGVDPLANVNLGLRKDRLLKSVVPGPVTNREDVHVAVGPTGAPVSVEDDQRLVINGAGNYIVRELGPARAAVPEAGTTPPVLELGTVVWLGFSSDHRELAAHLTLDPGIEAHRLPMSVQLAFHTPAGRPLPLGAGGRAPAAGVVDITLRNNTLLSTTVETGQARVGPLARGLDRLRTAAAHPRAAVPPVAGAGLPRSLPGRPTGRLAVGAIAPLRVTGTLTAPGGAGAITGPGLTASPGGVVVAGTLDDSVTFAVRVRPGDRIGMHLDARPWLDARTLDPPGGRRTWAAWARSRPKPTKVAAATQTFVTAVAAATRAAEYSPYLQADAPGTDLSTFTYTIAQPAAVRAQSKALTAHPGAIVAAVVALCAIAGNAVLLRRRI